MATCIHYIHMSPQMLLYKGMLPWWSTRPRTNHSYPERVCVKKRMPHQPHSQTSPYSSLENTLVENRSYNFLYMVCSDETNLKWHHM